MKLKKKTPGDKAAKHAARALGAFDSIVSGLNEANRLLEAEHDRCLDAADAHFEEARAMRKLGSNALLAASDAQDAMTKHDRILGRVAALVGD